MVVDESLKEMRLEGRGGKMKNGMNKSLILIILLAFTTLVVMGCTKQEMKEEPCGGKMCPEGYMLSQDCNCIMDMKHNQTFDVRNGSQIKLFNNLYNVELKPILTSDCKKDGIMVILSNKANESYNFTKSIEFSDMFYDHYIMGNLSLKDYDYNVDIHLEECDYTNPYVILKTYQDESKEESIDLSEGSSYTINNKTFKVKKIDVSVDSVDHYDNTLTMEKGDEEELGDSNYVLKLLDIDITTNKVRANGTTVTKEESTLATFEGDYSVEVQSIDFDIDPASVNVDVETMEETDEFTAPDGSKVKVEDINVLLNNCSMNCSVNMSNVTLKVKPYGDSSYHTYTLNEGDKLNVSSRLQLEVSGINIEVNANCSNETHICEVVSKNVEIRFVKVGPSCSSYNKEVTFVVTYPNTSEETVTLEEGEDYHLTSDVILTVDSVDVVLSDPDYSGNCEVLNKTVTFTFSPPVYDCKIDTKKAKFKVERFDDTDESWMVEGEEKTLLGVDINVLDITAGVTLSNDTCVVSNKKVKVSASHSGYCKVDSEKVKVEVNNEVESLDKGESFDVGESRVELVDITYDLNSECEVKNKKATFEIQSPEVQEFTTYPGEEKVVGMFRIKVDNISMDTELDGLECNLINKSVYLIVDTDYDHMAKWVEEDDQIVIGGGKVIVKEIGAEHPEEVEKWCTVDNISAILEWIPYIVQDVQNMTEES